MVEASLVYLAELGVLVVGVVIALQQLNDIKKTREIELETRKIQLFMDFTKPRLEEDWWDKVLEVLFQEWEDYEDWYNKYGSSTNRESWLKFQTLSIYFNSLGNLTRDTNMGINIVNEAVGSPCIMVWEKIRPLVYRERERMSSQYGTASRYLTSFEYLYEAIKEHRASL